MHFLACMIAIAGDNNNKLYKQHVSVAEFELLRIIHGANSCTEIALEPDVVRVDQLELREQLMERYPKHQKTIIGIWQNWGGGFPTEFRELQGLTDGHMAPERGALTKTADEIEDSFVAENGLSAEDLEQAAGAGSTESATIAGDSPGDDPASEEAGTDPASEEVGTLPAPEDQVI